MRGSNELTQAEDTVSEAKEGLFPEANATAYQVLNPCMSHSTQLSLSFITYKMEV